MDDKTKQIKLAFLFSPKGFFNPHYASPIVRWAFEMEQRRKKVEQSYHFFASSKRDDDTLDVSISFNSNQGISKLLDRILPSSLKTRLLPRVWCQGFYKKAKQYPILILENRLYYAPILRRLGYKGKIYVHLHNELFKKSSPQYLEKLDKSIDGLLSCCEAVLSPLKESCPNLYAKGQVIYNGVDTQYFFPRTDVKKDNVLLFVGRMVEQKGVHLLLETYRKLLGKYPDLILKLAGSASFGGGRELTEYEKKIKKEVDAINERGGTVEMLGFVEHDIELPKLYSEATVFCVSSQYTEAFPMVIVEAMFCGTAVVAPRLGGIPEALPSDELIYPEANVTEMYKRIDKILSDKTYREKVEAENLNFAKEHFTWDRIRDRFEEILTTIS
jgi:glycosyltransferase involved in cell wall biosynthesis